MDLSTCKTSGFSLSHYRNDEGWHRIINAKRCFQGVVYPEAERYGDPSTTKTSTGYSRDDDGWQRVGNPNRYPKQKPADPAADGGKIVPRESLAYGSYNVFGELVVEQSKTEQAKEALASFSEAAAKIDPSHLAAFLAGIMNLPDMALWRYYFYLEKAFSQVSLQWLKISPLSKKLIHFPLSHIPSSVYQTSADWINRLPTSAQGKFVTWATSRFLSCRIAGGGTGIC
ncbi:unnamed protein product [Microthlaspi erraticum]|uniref:Uncharacterized protein n=1 Tax=Microthlaspi erraticum TaxID=1685480 RepID=A0A6D2JPT3_9BRAS|nr:unnamed protein product [Microthlaspi erraticum]